MRKGVSNSDPTAMISAFTVRSVNENRSVRGLGPSANQLRITPAAAATPEDSTKDDEQHL